MTVIVAVIAMAIVMDTTAEGAMMGAVLDYRRPISTIRPVGPHRAQAKADRVMSCAASKVTAGVG